MPTIATLGGEQLLTSHRIGWILKGGSRPYQRTFQLPRAAAERLLAITRSGGTIDLMIHPEGYEPLVIKKLYALSAHATMDHPDILNVLVSDRRWLWPRIWIHRAYNIRRRTGERRILQEGGVPDQLAQIEDDVHYQPWSLFPRDAPSTPWTARQLVEDVLEELVPGEWTIATTLTRDLGVEGVVIDDIGPSALIRALGRLPGDELYQHPDGKIVVYDQRDGSEAAAVAAAGPPVAGPPLSTKLDLRATRPARVRVKFTREVEARFDSVAEGGTRVEDAREMINVAPVPDFTLTVGGRQVPQGTWLSIDELFTAWNADPRPVGTTWVWSHANVQAMWFLPQVLQIIMQGTGIDPDPIAMRRVVAINAYYRQVYQIDRKFYDRIAKFVAVRASILDTEIGVRAPAVAYSGWTQLFNRRAGAADIVRVTRFVESVAGYATRLADARVAPARVSILDGDQGIIRFTYQLDPDGRLAYVAPGESVGRAIADNELPEADPRREAQSDLGTTIDACRLSPNHSVATVLTIMPAAPNDERRLHEEVVEPSEAFAALGLPAPECNGPEWTLRVRPALETARFAWQDDNATLLDDLLGLTGSPAEADPGALGDPLNLDRLRALAVGAAAALYARMVDRIEGQLNCGWNPGLVPTGSIAAVEHTLHPNGDAITSAILPDEIDVESPMGLMDESIRRQILGLVAPTTGLGSTV